MCCQTVLSFLKEMYGALGEPVGRKLIWRIQKASLRMQLLKWELKGERLSAWKGGGGTFCPGKMAHVKSWALGGNPVHWRNPEGWVAGWLACGQGRQWVRRWWWEHLPRSHVGFRYLIENGGKSLKRFRQKRVTRFHFNKIFGSSLGKSVLAVGDGGRPRRWQSWKVDPFERD